MKITHTEVYRFSIRIEPFTIATGTMYNSQNVLIKIHTDEGLYGIGECSAFPVIVGETQDTCLVVARDFAALIKGKDALNTDELLASINSSIAGNTTVKSAFDMALYDLAAKASGLPLYKYLGGTRKEVETDITIGIGPVEDMVSRAISYQNSGARTLKIKLGKNVKEDITRVAKIREAVGGEMNLRIDANQGWSFEDAIFALNNMSAYNLEFCEQPMRTWYDDYLPKLRKVSNVKIMADESCYNHHDARKLIEAGACDYINIKLVKSGGIAEALKIHNLAQSNNVPCMLGCMLESRLALSANLHLALAAPNIIFYDLDTCLIGQLDDPVQGGVKYNGYKIEVPELPGLGADVDPGFLESCEKWVV